MKIDMDKFRGSEDRVMPCEFNTQLEIGFTGKFVHIGNPILFSQRDNPRQKRASGVLI